MDEEIDALLQNDTWKEFAINDLGELYFFLGIQAQRSSASVSWSQEHYVTNLLYTTIIRLDIAYAVNRACQDMQNPTNADWSAIKRIIRYLQGTVSYGLQFKRLLFLQLQAYSDADWAGAMTYKRSTSGMIFLGPNLISWCSRKEKTVSISSTEVEYHALTDATYELISLGPVFA
ncbi:uncharacterized protein LOC113280018 [Papaver somniferum]|uniref:uncharacterized protein LOC113280018 n=1 Tax=Papaver somniferum TaxID=3469 RepID=UPI000E6FCBA9|nr:uncharacterized protein LOC113280018 [Papaver somniferum]